MKKAIICTLLLISVLLCSCSPQQISVTTATVDPPVSPTSAKTATPAPSPTEPQPTETPLVLLKKQLEDKYPVEILYGVANAPQVPLYSYDLLTDEELIRASLIMIDKELSKYPKDLLIDLRVDETLPTRIILCASIYEGMQATEPCGGGFTEWDSQFVIFLQVTEETWQIVNNAPYVSYAFNHEIGHMILYYIERIAKGAPFDYTKWNRLNPPDFKYDNQIEPEEDTLGMLGSLYYVYETDPENVYFCDTYSKSAFPEDIATMFGYAMNDILPDFLSLPRIQSKMAYYFSIVRQVFATDAWDTPAYWEKALIS